MEFSWPEFASNGPVDGGRSWTAAFDSYDQYRELCYYLVKIFDGDWQVGEVTVEVGTEFAGDDWTAPACEFFGRCPWPAIYHPLTSTGSSYLPC